MKKQKLIPVVFAGIFIITLTVLAFASGGVISLPKTGQTTVYQTGDDGTYQMGTAWPNPRFNDNGNGTITDNLTGLMWEKAPIATTYTWANAITVRIAALNTAALGGYTDWRLPNVNELESLVHQGQANPASWLNTQGFTGIQDYYWSGSTCARTGNAWGVTMPNGGVDDYYKPNDYYVLGVRSGQ